MYWKDLEVVVANIEERMTKAGKTSYRVLVRKKGFPPLSATFKRKSEAERWARNTESAIDEGRHFKGSEAKRHTLGELIDRYSETVLPRKARGGYSQSLQLKWWKKRLGEKLLSDVTPAVIVEGRDRLQKGEGGRAKSPATVNRYMAALSHAFTVASREWQWVEDNPVLKVSKLSEPSGRVRFLDQHERGSLLEACRNSRNPYLYPIVMLAISTGMRRGEILNLKWADIDLDREHMVIHKTKNRERRGIHLSKPIREALKQHGKVRRLDSPLVFPGKNGSSPEDIRAAWQSALKVTGIKNFRFHDLRHTAASYLAMSGATPSEIAAVLGHKTLAMVQRYAHLSESHAAGVLARMNEKIFGEGQ